MPPRNEEELDPVTLHNQALMNIEDDATNGFKKLNFLLNNPPFPPKIEHVFRVPNMDDPCKGTDCTNRSTTSNNSIYIGLNSLEKSSISLHGDGRVYTCKSAVGADGLL